MTHDNMTNDRSTNSRSTDDRTTLDGLKNNATPLDGQQLDFDRRMRERHADAVASVSVRVQAQLQQRRRAALDAGASRRPAWGARLGWAGAASFAAVLALAIGVQRLEAPDMPTSHAMASTIAAVDDDDLPDAEPGAVGALDESPDFYVWLASSDANTFAME